MTPELRERVNDAFDEVMEAIEERTISRPVGDRFLGRIAAIRSGLDALIPQFPDHTHRWEERSQDTLDAEYRETGAVIGRWYCPDCYTDTMVKPDSLPVTPELRKPHPDCVEYVLEDGRRFAWSESNVQYEEVPEDGASFALLRSRLDRLRDALDQIAVKVEAASYHRNYRAACIDISEILRDSLQ